MVYRGTNRAFMNLAGAKRRKSEMRYGIVVAAATLALSATGARADQWCGYAAKDNAVIECGYSTANGCESAVGKGGMCFVDPDIAFNSKPVETPSKIASPITSPSGRS
jgi:hypothetical protein